MAATNITITIPDDTSLQRVVDAMAWKYNWNSGMGQTKAQFAKAQLIREIKNAVIEYEATVDSNAAYALKTANVNAINIT